MSKREVHRVLSLASPGQHGDDVRALQAGINEVLDHKGLDYARILQDGQAGPQTFNGAFLAEYCVGLERKRLRAANHKERLTEPVQRILRDRTKRSPQDAERAKRREDEIRAMIKQHNEGAAGAVRFAQKYVGVTESPAGSNKGPFPISASQKFYYGYDGIFWCGTFAGFCAEKGGNSAHLPRVGYHLYIVADARAGVNGFLKAVAPENARPGDIVSYGFQHIGLVVGLTQNGKLHTIEGNTSSGSSGSQSNGGGIFERKDRSVSDVLVVGRPDYSP